MIHHYASGKAFLAACGFVNDPINECHALTTIRTRVDCPACIEEMVCGFVNEDPMSAWSGERRARMSDNHVMSGHRPAGRKGGENGR